MSEEEEADSSCTSDEEEQEDSRDYCKGQSATVAVYSQPSESCGYAVTTSDIDRASETKQNMDYAVTCPARHL